MRPVQNLSLRKSLVLYIVLFVMFALALSIMTASVCETVADKINEKYPNTGCFGDFSIYSDTLL